MTTAAPSRPVTPAAPSWGEIREALAAAIEAGTRRRPQAFGTLYDDLGRSCALGALMEGLLGFMPHGADPVRVVHEHLGVDMGEIAVALPVGVCMPYFGDTSYSLDGAIMALNDVGHWDRERIAMWLRTIEL